jgi:hypothetical protein
MESYDPAFCPRRDRQSVFFARFCSHGNVHTFFSTSTTFKDSTRSFFIKKMFFQSNSSGFRSEVEAARNVEYSIL